jgi:lysophospholipase L1-like esterase
MSASESFSCLHDSIVCAPYVWKQVGDGDAARLEAAMPGAYLRATFTGATDLALIIDGVANAGCPPESMPVVEYSIDEQPFHVVALTRTDGEYALPLASQLDPAKPHRVEVSFRAADLTNGRWTRTASRLRLVGFRANPGAALTPSSVRPKRAIGFGDSITEGVGGDGEFTSWQKLEVNNARATWLPFVAAALNAEYGQLGSGGQGMVRALELPALTETWSRYDSETSRLVDGKLSPAPDYIFCAMGTNDFEQVITEEYGKWLVAIRDACPAAHIFCIVPPLQVHADEIAGAVAARRDAGDHRVHLIATEALAKEYRVGTGPTRMAHDGVHPSVEGQAYLGALIAAQASQAMQAERQP